MRRGPKSQEVHVAKCELVGYPPIVYHPPHIIDRSSICVGTNFAMRTLCYIMTPF